MITLLIHSYFLLYIRLFLPYFSYVNKYKYFLMITTYYYLFIFIFPDVCTYSYNMRSVIDFTYLPTTHFFVLEEHITIKNDNIAIHLFDNGSRI